MAPRPVDSLVRRWFLPALVITACSLAGCDRGSYEASRSYSEPLRVVSTNFGQGVAPPADGTLRIAFSLPIDPGSLSRQSVALLDSRGEPSVVPVVRYDPVAKVVSLEGPQRDGSPWLTPKAFYSVRFPADDADTGQRALRAVNGARIASEPIGFFAGPPQGNPAKEPVMDFCADVLPVFRARCTDAGCHGGTGGPPPLGLRLDDPENVARTAVRRVAQGATTGPRPGVPATAPRVFGVDMPIIAPGVSGESWLLYKLLLSEVGTEESPAACSPVRAPLAANGPGDVRAEPWSTKDREALGQTVIGSPMPLARGGPPGSEGLTYAELQRLRAWIDQGAVVRVCAPCGAPSEGTKP